MSDSSESAPSSSLYSSRPSAIGCGATNSGVYCAGSVPVADDGRDAAALTTGTAAWLKPGTFSNGLAKIMSRTRSASSRFTPECTLRVCPSIETSASSTSALVLPSARASWWTLRRSGRSPC
ncbi:hypothetical protein BN971_01939 [Mycobacterium bohemicum DSM 44277]|uniref:Uncharacterized protein n=1 Tax=Mycobacterium bohemicum DSM 44277 TaxID=1236609 RepID=A0A0U0W794_MYCBE|nr:hypothetical protein BN971_01939 [Mycobacterium bohemicum DSM 44277]